MIGIRRTQINNKINEFLDDYCDYFNLTTTKLKSSSRKRELSEKRMMLSYFLRNKIGLTYQDIGSLLNRHHSSIIFHVKSIEEFLTHDVYFKLLYKGAHKVYNKYLNDFDGKIDILSELVNENARLQRKLKRVEAKIEILNEKLYEE